MTALLTNLLDLSEFAGRRLLARVQGVTDDEYFWEPVPDVWTVRAGTADWSPVPPEPAPFTTLAWRITHLTDIMLAERTATWFGLEVRPEDGAPGVPSGAAEAVRDLTHAYEVWQRRLGSIPAGVLAGPMGPIAGPYAEHDGCSFALHILDEVIHHGAEVGVVRDLYRQHQPQDPFVLAVLTGDADAVAEASDEEVERVLSESPDLLAAAASRRHWEVVRRLAGRGFSVDARGPGGVTAAHLAAGADDVSALELLVSLGADLGATDPAYDATPLGWAEFFGKSAATAYLRGAG